MPQVKIKHVLSFSSQDSINTVEKFVNGKGSWLSSTSDKTGTLKADLQLERAVSISHIDVGNAGSMMLSIEVGRSSWAQSEPFVTLLPTVTLITPADWRIGKNLTSVKMFKSADFDGKNKTEKWDKIRLICSHPFCKNKQIGLSFIKIYTTDVIKNTATENVQPDAFKSDIESKKQLLLNRMNLTETKVKMSQSLKTLEKNKLVQSEVPNSPNISSPVSRAAKIIMAGNKVKNYSDRREELKTLEIQALEFIISLELSIEQMEALKVSVIRNKFEDKLKRALTAEERSVFKNIALDYAARRFDENEKYQKPQTNTNSHNSTTPLRNNTINYSNSLNSNRQSKDVSGTTNVGGFKFKQIQTSSKCNQDSPSIKRKYDNTPSFSQSSPGESFKKSKFENQTKPSTPRSTQNKRDPNDFTNSGTWLSKVGKENKNTPNLSQDSDEICIVNEEITFPCGGKLDSTPKNKFGINIKRRSTESTSMVECPLCSDFFPSHKIELHANSCGSESYPTIISNEEKCPMCGDTFSIQEIEHHASLCGD